MNINKYCFANINFIYRERSREGRHLNFYQFLFQFHAAIINENISQKFYENLINFHRKIPINPKVEKFALEVLWKYFHDPAQYI